MSSSTGNSVGSAPSAPSKPPRANLSNAVPEHVSSSLAQQQDIGQVKEVGQLLSKQSCRRSSTVGRGSASPSVTSRYSSAENLNEMKKVGLLLSRQSSRRSSAGGRASAPSSVSSRNSSAETLNADQDNTSSSLAQLEEPRQMKEVGKLLSRQSSRRSSAGGRALAPSSVSSRNSSAETLNADQDNTSSSLAQLEEPRQMKEVGKLLSRQSSRRSSAGGRALAPSSISSRCSSAETLNAAQHNISSSPAQLEEPGQMKEVGQLLSRQSSRSSSTGGRAISSRYSSAETLNAAQHNISSSPAQLEEPGQMKKVGQLLSRQSSRSSITGSRASARSSVSSRNLSAETLNATQDNISSSPAQLEEPRQMKEVGQLLSRQSSRRLSVGGRASAPSSVSSRYSSAEALNAHKLEEPRQKKKSSLSSSISSSSRVPGSQPLLSRQSSKRSIAGSSGLTPSVILSRHSISNSSTNLQGKVEDTQFKSSDTINETMGKSQSKRKPIAKRNSFRNSVSRFQSLFHKKSCGERLEEHDCLVV